MADQKFPITFIGLGAMGFGMATNLVQQGFTVTGYDSYGPSLDRFHKAGGITATSPAEAVKDKEIIVCMVATAEQAQSVLLDAEDAAIKALKTNAAILLCSTVPSGYVQGLEKELSRRGRGDIFLVDCPVSGGAGRAAAGSLSIMAGASEESISKSLPVLQAMSDPQKLYIVQGGVGAGSNMKMCHQVLAAVQILSASEAMGFATHLGLDLPKTAGAVIDSEAWTWMFENRLPRMLDPQFQPLASAVTIILKDASIISSEARRAHFSTPMTTIAEQVYLMSLGRGYGADDDSSLIRMYTGGYGKTANVKGLVQDDQKKLMLVINMLKSIHLCAVAETIAFAHHVHLDLDQVLELCVNAAGGSRMLSNIGQEVIQAIRDGNAARGWPSSTGQESLETVAQQLQESIDEAQRRKVPVFLGCQALHLIQSALRMGLTDMTGQARGSVIRMWVETRNL